MTCVVSSRSAFERFQGMYVDTLMYQASLKNCCSFVVIWIKCKNQAIKTNEYCKRCPALPGS